jgi:GNAT superfamily N-acetyltransferase
MRLQELDLTAASLPEPTVATASLAEAGRESIQELYLATLVDVPAPTPRNATDADFRRQVVESEIVEPEASRVVLEDGEAVAFTVVIANDESGRCAAQLTGVRRDRRGRGLAQAVKTASAWYARERGLRVLVTLNDLDNEPMLAVNRKLGFEPSALVEEYRKEL